VAGDGLKVAVGGGLDFSSFDGVARPQDPTRSNCFGRRRIWCPRRLLRVLGFNSLRGKIRAPWPPIYRGFGLISKRILLRSRFDSSIELFSALVWITSMGKSLGLLRAWDDATRAGPAGPVGGLPGRTVEPPLAATRVARRRQAGPVRRFQPMAERKNKKGCLFFNLF
jgi:hypothetical protein